MRIMITFMAPDVGRRPYEHVSAMNYLLKVRRVYPSEDAATLDPKCKPLSRALMRAAVLAGDSRSVRGTGPIGIRRTSRKPAGRLRSLRLDAWDEKLEYRAKKSA